MIRLANATDLPALAEIEKKAGEIFRDIGMGLIADDDPPSIGELKEFQAEDRAFVAPGTSGEPVAYLLVDVVDANAHIEQVSVHPDAARRGLGAALIDHTEQWAARRGLGALTLTTFVRVPWNAPYYERIGFRVIADPDLTPGLRRIRDREAELGLDRWPRVVMRREVEAR